MKYTINKKLKLPEYTDPVDIAEINENFETIDADMTAHEGDTENPHKVTLAQLGVTVGADKLNDIDNKSDEGHEHNYAGSSSAGGSANSAVKLDTSAGSETQPVYFKDGKPVKTTHTLGASVPSDAKFTDTVYTHPTTSGNKHIPSGGSSGKILRWSADGTAVWGDETAYDEATADEAGLMSTDDKNKLDSIEDGANKTVVDSEMSDSSTNPVQNKVVKAAITTVQSTATEAKAIAEGRAPAYTYGTTDLIAGSSPLAAGTLYFVYE